MHHYLCDSVDCGNSGGAPQHEIRSPGVQSLCMPVLVHQVHTATLHRSHQPSFSNHRCTCLHFTCPRLDPTFWIQYLLQLQLSMGLAQVFNPWYFTQMYHKNL